MSREGGNSQSSILKHECSSHFLNKIRKTKMEVDLFLLSGIHLTGYITEFDDKAIVFHGGPKDGAIKEQLVLRTAIASIIPKED